MERFWHGSKPFINRSLCHLGPVNHNPVNGPTGVYCFSEARGTKGAYYGHYILSRPGWALSAFAQFAIPSSKTKKYPLNLRYSHSQDIPMTVFSVPWSILEPILGGVLLNTWSISPSAINPSPPRMGTVFLVLFWSCRIRCHTH